MQNSSFLKLIALFVGLSFFAPSCAIFKKNKPATKPKTSKANKPASATEVQYRKKISDYAQKHIGTEYNYGGKQPSTGFDCSGFTYYVFDHFDIKVSPASRMQATEGKEVPLNKVQAADLIFFGEGKKVSHVAMVVRRDKDGVWCVHSTTSRGVIVENVSASAYWKPKILFARNVL